MNTCERSKTLFVGIDVHKDTHTAVGLTPFGEKIFEMKIGNEAHDFVSLIERTRGEAQRIGLSPSFGLEDVHSWGERLSSFLIEEGLPVRAIAPILVDHARKRATHPEKNDSLDAQGVAEVMIRKIDNLPAYTLTKEAETAKNIRDISLDREHLVKERTRLKNQVHTLLYRIFNTEYANEFKDPFSIKALRHWMKSRPKDVSPFLMRSMKRKVRRLMDIRQEIQELEKELETLIKESGHTIQTASGCGIVIAGEIIGEIGDISRFHSPARLAKYAGCAPRECSSGKTVRWRKTRGGNRRLNRAFHRMALSQISRMGNTAAQAYFKRKVSEGKSKSQALVCLRRQLVNVVWMMLKHKTEYVYPQKNL
ncbi:MAG: IS110 family transposase [Candidatus Spechtbacterales bacterium]